MPHFPLAAVMVAASLLFVPPAHACSCSGEAGPLVVSDTDVIFVGTVLAQEVVEPYLHVTLVVEHNFQGAGVEAIQVRALLGGAAFCSYDFALDDTYLVFGDASVGGEPPLVWSCGRTSRLALATEQLAMLDAWELERRQAEQDAAEDVAVEEDSSAEEDAASEHAPSHGASALAPAPRAPKPAKGKAKGCGVAPGQAGDAQLLSMLSLLALAVWRVRRVRAKA